MNIVNTIKTVSASQKLGAFSLAGLLFILPFAAINTLKEVLFITGILSFLSIKMFHHDVKALSSPNNRPLHSLIIVSFLWGFITLMNAIDPAYSLNELTFKMSRQYLLYFLSFSFAFFLSSAFF